MGYQKFMKQSNLINGDWVHADNRKSFNVLNPATGEIIGSVPASGYDETQKAIGAAAAAFPSYSTKPLLERVALLWKLHDDLLDNQ